MDLGRLAMVPLMAALLTLNVMAVWRSLTADASTAAQHVGAILTLCFYGLIIHCYLRRAKPRRPAGQSRATSPA